MRAVLFVVVVLLLTRVAGATDDPVPHVVRYAAPSHTEAARRGRVEGTVTVEVVVAADGTVKSSHTTNELRLGLDWAVHRVLPSWRFNKSALAERTATLEFTFILEPFCTKQSRSLFEAPYRVKIWTPGPALDYPAPKCPDTAPQ